MILFAIAGRQRVCHNKLSFSPISKPLAISGRQSVSPLRLQRSLFGSGRGVYRRTVDQIDLTDHYARSQKDLRRVSIQALRSFANTPPIHAAITRIRNGIVRMPWYVMPPDDLKDDPIAQETVDRIRAALENPNIEETDTYSLFVKALIQDLLIYNVAAVERHPGMKGDSKPFWLWTVDPSHIEFNADWTPQTEGVIPRYYDTQGKADSNQWRSLLSKELFLVKYTASSYELIPPGPLEICFNHVAAWLGLTDFQQTTTSQASREYILDIGECTPEELGAFRQYFAEDISSTMVIGTKNGSQLEVKKLGARTDDELYLKYEEKIIRFLALAFQLSPRDLNISSDDSYATADISAQSSFQFAILPMAECWFERLQLDVIKYFFPGYSVQPADTEPRHQLDEAETAKTLYKDAGLITRNEGRLAVGRDSLGEEGDVFSDGTRLNPVEPEEPEPTDPDLIESRKKSKLTTATRRKRIILCHNK